jgi:hypothetical protein
MIMIVTDNPQFRKTAIAAAVVLLIGLMAVTGVRVARVVGAGEPQQAYDLTDLDAADLEKPPLSDEENAAAWLQAGAAAIVWTEAEKATIGEATLAPYDRWPTGLWSQVRAVLQRHNGALETLHRAALLERSNYGIRYSQGVAAEMPADLLGLLDASRLLMVEARIAMVDGDERRTLTALQTMARLATSLQDEPTTITTLVGIACGRMMLTVAAEVTQSEQPRLASDDVLDELEQTLPTTEAREIVARLFDAWTAVLEVELNRRATAAEVESTPDIDRARLHQLQSELVELVGVPYGTDPARFANPVEGVVLESDPQVVLEDVQGFVKVIERLQALQAQRQLVHAGITVRRIALDDGVYPVERPAIAELVDHDPFTGRRLVYEPRVDGSLELALDGAVALLEQIIPQQSARTLVPIVLPRP